MENKLCPLMTQVSEYGKIDEMFCEKERCAWWTTKGVHNPKTGEREGCCALIRIAEK